MPITCLPAGLKGVPKWTIWNREGRFPCGRGDQGLCHWGLASKQLWTGPDLSHGDPSMWTHNDRQTGWQTRMKTVPSHKLRMRAVMAVMTGCYDTICFVPCLARCRVLSGCSMLGNSLPTEVWLQWTVSYNVSSKVSCAEEEMATSTVLFQA